MFQPMYQWNGTPLIIPCDPAVADAYNRRCEQFIEAQLNFEAEHGRKWGEITRSDETHDYLEPFKIRHDDEAQRAYDLVGAVINALVACCEGGIAFPEDMVDGTGLVRVN